MLTKRESELGVPSLISYEAGSRCPPMRMLSGSTVQKRQCNCLTVLTTRQSLQPISPNPELLWSWYTQPVADCTGVMPRCLSLASAVEMLRWPSPYQRMAQAKGGWLRLCSLSQDIVHWCRVMRRSKATIKVTPEKNPISAAISSLFLSS